MINAPNFASSAHIGSHKDYEIEENSILIPDYYIFHFKNRNWLVDQQRTINREVKPIYTWDSKTEKAFFMGAPTSLYMNSFEDLGLPIDPSYSSVLKIYEHFKEHKQVYPRLEAVLISQKYPDYVEAKLTGRIWNDTATNVAMLRHWPMDDQAVMKKGQLDYFYGYFDSLPSFVHWRYPICNTICNFEQDRQNPIATLWYDW